MNRKYLFISAAIIMFIFINAGCGRNNDKSFDTRSMAQIHEQEGYPVTVIKLEKSRFASTLEYTAPLSGAAESSKAAMVSGNIEKIHFKTGDYVKKDTVVIDFPVNTPGSGYNQAKVSYENSFETFRRMERLYSSNGISRQEYDNARTGYEVAKANWEAVRDMIHVKAPVSGIITRMDARENNHSAAGDPLFTVSDYSRLRAGIWVSEKDYHHIKPGIRAEAAWKGHTIAGEVIRVDLSLNPEMSAFGALLEFDNSGLEIKSGVTASVKITVYENPQAIAVNRRYISGTPGNLHVFVAEDDMAVMRKVQTGRMQGQMTEITEGLSEGDILIAEGNRIVSDKSRIRITAEE